MKMKISESGAPEEPPSPMRGQNGVMERKEVRQKIKKEKKR